MQEHVYTSSKGEIFLSWHDWALSTLSEEEFDIYSSETLTTEKEALYTRWVTDEQIISHVIMEDDTVIETLTYSQINDN
jgi:hypothetical protein